MFFVKLNGEGGGEKNIVDLRFLTSWTMTSANCTQAHVQQNKSIFLSIYFSVWKRFWKWVYIYIYLFIYFNYKHGSTDSSSPFRWMSSIFSWDKCGLKYNVCLGIWWPIVSLQIYLGNIQTQTKYSLRDFADQIWKGYNVHTCMFKFS